MLSISVPVHQQPSFGQSINAIRKPGRPEDEVPTPNASRMHPVVFLIW